MVCCMSKRVHILGSAFNIIGGPFGVPGWLLRFARPMLVAKAVLAARLLADERRLAPRVSLERGAPTQGTGGLHVRYRPRRGAAIPPLCEAEQGSIWLYLLAARRLAARMSPVWHIAVGSEAVGVFAWPTIARVVAQDGGPCDYERAVGLDRRRGARSSPRLERRRRRTDRLAQRAGRAHVELRKITRQAILSNPLLDFDSILFVARGVLNDHKRRKSEYDGDHFCDQYYGHNGRRGGGLLILKNWKSEDAEVVDVLFRSADIMMAVGVLA